MVKKEGTALILKTPDKIEERPPDDFNKNTFFNYSQARL